MSEFLTIGDLAKRYKISKATVFNLIRKGQLPSGFCIGKSRRFRIEELEAFEHELTGRSGENV